MNYKLSLILFGFKIVLLTSLVDCQEKGLIAEFRVLGGVPVENGNETYLGEFPFMAAIGWENKKKELEFMCGGMFINWRMILTAAHCLHNKDGKLPDVVFLGGKPLSSYNESADLSYRVREAIVYPEYDPQQAYHDIAILKLELFHSDRYNNLRPVCLWDKEDLVTNDTLAIGYGLTDFAGRNSKQLLKVNLTVFSVEYCEAFYKGQKKYKSGVSSYPLICAGDKDETKDTCQGDSGGPLIIQHKGKNYAVGITSAGQACSGFPPAIYTKISPYMDWIFNVSKREGLFLESCEEITEEVPEENGNETQLGDFPFMAAIGRKDENKDLEFFCSGVLISWRIVLTAAHCALNENGKPPNVVFLGGEPLSSYNASGDLSYVIQKVIIHEKYDPHQGYHDIVLLKLEPFHTEDKGLRPVCLWHDEDLPTNETIEIEYGVAEIADGKGSKQLLKANLTVFSVEFCEQFYKRDNKFQSGISNAHICAGDTVESKDTCQFFLKCDSGGPIIIQHEGKNYVVGITSLVGQCCGFSTTISTKISTYIEWIFEVLNREGQFLESCDDDEE